MPKSKSKVKVMPNAKVFIDKWNNKDQFTIWNTDDDGKKKGEYPIISMGIRKVNHVLAFEKELKEFAKDQNKDS